MIDLASRMFPDQPGDQAPPQAPGFAPAAPAPQPRPAARQPTSLVMSKGEVQQRAIDRSLAAMRQLLGEDDDDVDDEAEPAQKSQPRQAAPQPQVIDPLVVPPEVAAARKASMTIEDRMFAGTPVDLGGAADGVLRYDNPLASDSQLSEYAAEVGNVLTKDFLSSTDDAKQILNLAMQHRTTPPDERQVGQMRREASHQLIARYGKSANQVLADAKVLIQRDPRVVRALDAFNLGDNPRVVLAACEAAVRARAQGKFPVARSTRR